MYSPGGPSSPSAENESSESPLSPGLSEVTGDWGFSATDDYADPVSPLPVDSPREKYRSPSTMTSPKAYVRNQISSQVNECLWLKGLKEEYNKLLEETKAIKSQTQQQRCVLCTLPYGTCVHTRKKVGGVMTDTQRRKITEIDIEIDDVLSVMGDGVQIEASADADAVDINALSWRLVEIRLSDRIGVTSVALSVPRERGWHTVTNLGNKFLVMHGGLSFRKGQVPQPFSVVTKQEDVRFEPFTLLFNIEHMSWHKSGCEKYEVPPGRYGHVAAALDDNRMLIYGGRGVNGDFLSDTWIFDLSLDKWESVQIGIDRGLGQEPPPRVFAACVRQGACVYLFGGTDGGQNFCDLWLFRIDVSRWERAVPVGPPPSPRYGHRMVSLNKQRVVILGGCSVCPFSEVGGGGVTGGLMGMGVDETKAIFDLGRTLEGNYRAEGEASVLGGQVLQQSIEDGDVKSVLRTAASIAGRVSALEYETRATEQQLLKSWQLSQGAMILNSRKAKHPTPHLDMVHLDTVDLVWKAASKSTQATTGNPDTPCSRIHFGAAAMGGYIVVVGGLHPTCLRHSLVDAVPGSEGVRVHVLDPKTRSWAISRPKASAQYLDGPISIAEADLIRARQRVEAERCRGLSLGALNGKTIELAEAEAVLQVCEWRKEMLLREKDLTRPAPAALWGMGGLELVRQRAFMLGGWEENCAASMQKGCLLLDLEHEHERVRRMADEFSAKLERERMEEEAKARLNNFLSEAELRALQEKERQQEERERRIMSIEEILSSLPPLSKPKPVQFVKSNDHTIWVQWEQAQPSEKTRVVDPESVVYMLYAKGGFTSLLRGDKVLVTPLSDALAEIDSKSKAANSQSSVETVAAPSKKRYFPGEISNNGVEGFFQVFFDDGTSEKRVHRNRIRLNPAFHDTVPKDSSLLEATVRSEMAAAVKARMVKREQSKLKRRMSMAKFNPALAPPPGEAADGGSRKSRKLLALSMSMKNKAMASTRISGGQYNKKEAPVVVRSLLDELREHVDIPAAIVESKIDSDDDEDGDGDHDSETGDSIQLTAKQTTKIEEDSQYLAVSEIIANAKERVTFMPGPEWRLLYVGNGTSYACTGLVPDAVLLNEPRLTVSVQFVVQTWGMEYPAFERSQLSDAVELSTCRSRWDDDAHYARAVGGWDSMLGEADDEESNSSLPGVSSTGAASSRSILFKALDEESDSHRGPNVKTESIGAEPGNGGARSNAMSRRKKDFVTAKLGGHQLVQIERQYNHAIGSGTNDHYM